MSQNTTRSNLFDALQSLSEIAPEMRAGQLMAAIGEFCADLHGRGLWDATDEELIEAVWRFRSNFEAATDEIHGRTGGQPTSPLADRFTVGMR